MNEGINELAHVTAWWLSHPWQALGVYLAFFVSRAFVTGLIRSASHTIDLIVGEKP